MEAHLAGVLPLVYPAAKSTLSDRQFADGNHQSEKIADQLQAFPVLLLSISSGRASRQYRIQGGQQDSRRHAHAPPCPGWRFFVDGAVAAGTASSRTSALSASSSAASIRSLSAGGGPRLAGLTFSVLRIALNKAFNEEILHRLSFKTVSLPKKRRNEFTPLSSVEWERLFTTAETDAEMYTALSLEWGTGISRSELLGLKWIDFNFTTRVSWLLMVSRLT